MMRISLLQHNIFSIIRYIFPSRNVNFIEQEQNGNIDNDERTGTAWSIARTKEKKEDIPTLEEMRLLINSIEYIEDRVLVAIAYLTAGRISEIVRAIRKEDIHFGPYYGTDCMLIKMPNRKHKTRHEKDIPVPISREEDLVAMIKWYVDSLIPGSFLFDFSRVTAWKKIRKYCGFTSHWLRHIRLTHMVTIYDFNDQKLIKLAGWTDSRPAKYYIELRAKDIIY